MILILLAVLFYVEARKPLPPPARCGPTISDRYFEYVQDMEKMKAEMRQDRADSYTNWRDLHLKAKKEKMDAHYETEFKGTTLDYVWFDDKAEWPEWEDE